MPLSRAETLAMGMYEAAGLETSWPAATPVLRNAVYHLMRFLDEIEVEQYDLAYLVRVCSTAWVNQATRQGSGIPLASSLGKTLELMIQGYLKQKNSSPGHRRD